jgi:DNA polymerase III delta prime subunit
MRYQSAGLLMRGGEEEIESALVRLKDYGLLQPSSANPDLFVRFYRHFGIDEARDSIERAARRGLSGKRYFVLAFDTISRDAEHALLKTLEEPPADAFFVLITPAPEMLLPTLRSRLFFDRVHVPPKKEAEAKAFIAASPAERIERIKPYCEKDEEGERKTGAILSFLASLEPLLASSPRALRALYETRKYISDNGASHKLLLERLALRMPRA